MKKQIVLLACVFSMAISTQAQAGGDCNTTLNLLTQNWNSVSDMMKVCSNSNYSQDLRHKAFKTATKALDNLVKIGKVCKNTCRLDAESLAVCADSDESIHSYRSDLSELCN